jgi:hypothetical protein
VERPWALVRFGSGTSVAFLVKETERGHRGWIVWAKWDSDAKRTQWRCRFQTSTTIGPGDLIRVFPYALPDSPSLGDIELLRAKFREQLGR